MSYFNNTHDANFHPTSDVSEESGFYPFVEQMPVTEEVCTVDWSSTVEQQESATYSPTDLWTMANYWGECQFGAFVGRCLTREPQTQWIWLPRTRLGTTAMVSWNTLDTIGQPLANRSNITTQASRAGTFPLQA